MCVLYVEARARPIDWARISIFRGLGDVPGTGYVPLFSYALHLAFSLLCCCVCVCVCSSGHMPCLL